MNSAVEPSFNKNFAKKRGLWVLWTVHGTHCGDANMQPVVKNAIQTCTKCLFG